MLKYKCYTEIRLKENFLFAKKIPALRNMCTWENEAAAGKVDSVPGIATGREKFPAAGNCAFSAELHFPLGGNLFVIHKMKGKFLVKLLS